MADYADLRPLFTNDDLNGLIEVAVAVAAQKIQVEDVATENHANRLVWAKEAWANPRGKAKEMQIALIAAERDATVGNITGASDAAIQTRVDAAVNVFAGS